MSPKNQPMAHFALIHSPLASPLTWQPAAAALRRHGHAAYVPDLRDAPGGGPYWEQHARSAAEQLAGPAAEAPLVLAAHSGAGALLPAIRRALGQAVAGYVFVDAGLP
ncbi:MAG: alpha/beta hydrolase, partial [Anaerolineales bacterium]|nr:alpha/beta hydrolase [Anaerolineales bacterium]